MICSTRPGRIGGAIGAWAHEYAQFHGGFESTLVDLQQFALPVFDEPDLPRHQSYRHAHTLAWSASVEKADAFLFVTPEHNHFPPASLVNALSFLSREWNYKPVGFVSYGGVSGGMRGVEVTKQLLTTFKAVPMVEGVIVPVAQQYIGPGKVFNPNDLHQSSALAMLDELLRWTEALSVLRRKPAGGPTRSLRA
ncbi:MAG TPA: NADPH-dependent FMN reductase [Polyangiaceae bacterium]|nr:NADPH-dependent FMN reductase [Polyangiaceae bacterium]